MNRSSLSDAENAIAKGLQTGMSRRRGFKTMAGIGAGAVVATRFGSSGASAGILPFGRNGELAVS